jgi:hypothetical protein
MIGRLRGVLVEVSGRPSDGCLRVANARQSGKATLGIIDTPSLIERALMVCLHPTEWPRSSKESEGCRGSDSVNHTWQPYSRDPDALRLSVSRCLSAFPTPSLSRDHIVHILHQCFNGVCPQWLSPRTHDYWAQVYELVIGPLILSSRQGDIASERASEWVRERESACGCVRALTMLLIRTTGVLPTVSRMESYRARWTDAA